MPAELSVHLVVDNSSIHSTATIKRWLKKHPRFQMHFVPTYSSWLNLVERWFAKLTEDALRRGSHPSAHELETAVAEYLEATNEDPKPFIWTKQLTKSSPQSHGSALTHSPRQILKRSADSGH